MKSLIIPAVFIYFFSIPLKAQERPVYLKMEKGDPYVSVFKKPGLNWKYCTKNKDGECIESMGWLDQDSKVWVTGPKIKAATPDPFTNEMVEEEYYPVQFEYTRVAKDKDGKPLKDQYGKPIVVEHVKGPIGYVDAAYVDFESRDPLYSPPRKSANASRSCSLAARSDHKKVDEIKCALELKNIEDASSKIKDSVGECAHLKDDSPKRNNIYDNAILNRLKKVPTPAVKGEDNKDMTQKQLIEIDALARTLYGEMASCFKHGLHYPMAVARIAVNRSEDNSGRKKTFIQGKHQEEKPTLSKVLTTPSQFSVWLRTLNGKANPALQRSMCPPKDPKQVLWTGQKPIAQELSAWNHAVQIATEAVLFPSSFKRRTEKLDKRYFYTSGMGHFYNMKKDSVKVEGRSLEKSSCIEIWKENKS